MRKRVHDVSVSLDLRAPFASLFEDGSQLLQLPVRTILQVRPRDVRVMVRTTGGEFTVVHSDGPVEMQLTLLSGSNLRVSDGHREIQIQFPGWKFRKVAEVIHAAGVDLDAVGLFGRSLYHPHPSLEDRPDSADRLDDGQS